MILNFMLSLCSILLAESTDQLVSNRQLLIFGKDNNKSLVQKQTLILDSVTAGIKERDLKIIYAGKDEVLNSRYHIQSSQFTVILIGKDGGEKLRRYQPIGSQELFAIIDAMPMRKSEIGKKTTN